WGKRRRLRMEGYFADFPAVVRDIMQSHGLTYKTESIDRLAQERILEKTFPFRNIQPEIIEMLQGLKQNDFKLGLISNCTAEEVTAWSECALAPLFDHVIFSFEAGRVKPDPEIYLLSCERLGVRPQEAAFVGDGGADELAGAERAGIKAFHAFWFNTYIESPYRKLKSPKEF